MVIQWDFSGCFYIGFSLWSFHIAIDNGHRKFVDFIIQNGDLAHCKMSVKTRGKWDGKPASYAGR